MEVLIVVGLIGILSSIVIYAVNEARENSQIKAETVEVEQFSLHMRLYAEQFGHNPPGTASNVDNCSICYLDPEASGSYSFDVAAAVTEWALVADALNAAEITAGALYEDQWGNPYGYDNNLGIDGVGNADFWSVLCSMGPDGELQTFNRIARNTPTAIDSPWGRNNPSPQALGDDICIFF